MDLFVLFISDTSRTVLDIDFLLLSSIGRGSTSQHVSAVLDVLVSRVRGWRMKK
ncbi:hypothetical protein M6B38_337380 [Iris pallida]|uniref:Uncharacterized protein n=1 Tax=Iris pallida TaxID=29817 RepID=A0AAX6GZS2_IRIPA|nr:hypothetical protein M6B38_337380 [Iris pallida]